MKIKIIAVGKIKEKYLVDGINEYLKRISRYSRIEVIEIPDEKVQKDKGTGLVMCCTFGDQTDMEWQKKHQLPIKEAITK